ncbi:cytochrome d ubiquinol oxidase subunit II [Pseudobacteriovorax antillogorgiicola]|uniref:Cytochrome bd-I ubiquinol oxidase subunit 2 apoprotein n=1 Tax=Pseudobacteriovorax antillogorgiicola TaxID=1513793 RepID=A0A1Y6BX12_9BACT|nr:cytochrome d ubiquinol oxidase subunit II [Pseudobacteriovorax antillogorgiicola]TCS53766.1 cytochrome bd-I ubiquinol oxidase subunit 2 apoprotein [Pseudobacteriovorax antillogorgiicola]SMF22495.1 cytochrome bd-I ubiquinol oxidase subunit 2 apoprotein [Pseudobacteriovorax antillogorgiicola]
MVEVILFFLGASLILYCILGGADFGAGIIEIVSPQKMKNEIESAVYKGMGPVWEANHMWIILAVVILFNGFPKIYAELSIYLHIPLTAMLMGIIFRGCAFTFRHYDAKADKSTEIYGIIFRYSSLLTSLILGVIAGSLAKGSFQEIGPGLSYWQVYGQPWLSPFTVAVGLLVTSLFAYQSAVFFVGEPVSNELKKHFVRKAKQFNIVAIITGILVFLFGWAENINLLDHFFTHPVSLISLILATLILGPIWWGLSHFNRWVVRALSGAQMALVIIGWVAFQFPDVVRFRSGASLDLYTHAAPESTITVLAIALLAGSLIIFPALFYLFRVFKQHESGLSS